MSYHRYKARNFAFAQLLVNLRKKASLTQDEVAQQVGVSTKTIRNWEGGSNFPTDLNLQKLVELYLEHDAFSPGHEQEEAHALWSRLQESTPHRISSFDEQWFASMLAQRQAYSPDPEPSASGHQSPAPSRSLEQQLPTSLPSLETAQHDASPSLPSERLLRGDWREAIDISSWHGRADELAELGQWLLVDRCRLVSLLGIGGIGKTTLAIKLVQQVTPHFDCVLWRSLYNAPSLEEVLQDWIPILSEQRYPSPPHTIEQSLALLIGLLQERRCLLVLDNLETLFQQSHYRQGYEDYGTLIQLVAQTTHQSCLLLTSRELFLDVGVIPSSHTPVRLFRVPGLDLAACQQLLHEKGLFGEQKEWQELVRRYGGNPLALKVVAETIQAIFGGNIAAFLAQGMTIFRGVRQLLTQQFERLSPLEQTLMCWLAVEREPISLEALQANLRYPTPKIEAIEALHALHNRSLVERGERGIVFTLQPVILEYVTERLVTLVSQEIEEGRPVLLLTHALLQAQAKDYLRTSQARLILQPVLDRLMSHFGSQERLEELLDLLLRQLRTIPPCSTGLWWGQCRQFVYSTQWSSEREGLLTPYDLAGSPARGGSPGRQFQWIGSEGFRLSGANGWLHGNSTERKWAVSRQWQQ